jgi:hypothetical protein
VTGIILCAQGRTVRLCDPFGLARVATRNLALRRSRVGAGGETSAALMNGSALVFRKVMVTALPICPVRWSSHDKPDLFNPPEKFL